MNIENDSRHSTITTTTTTNHDYKTSPPTFTSQRHGKSIPHGIVVTHICQNQQVQVDTGREQ